MENKKSFIKIYKSRIIGSTRRAGKRNRRVEKTD